MIITEFTSTKHLSVSWAVWILSTPPYPTSWKSILILSSHLFLVLPSGLFPSVSPPKPYISLPTPYKLHAHTSHFSRPYRKQILGEQCRSLISSWCSSLHSSVTSSLLMPNILLNPLFSSTLSLLSFFNLSDQISHPYKKRHNYISLYFNL